MKKGQHFLFLMLLGLSCTKEKLDDCRLSDAMITYLASAGVEEERQHFFEEQDRLIIHGFDPGGDGFFPEEPSWVRVLNYEQGKVIEDITTKPDQPEYSHRYEYSLPISHKQSFRTKGPFFVTWIFESTGRMVSLNYNCN